MEFLTLHETLQAQLQTQIPALQSILSYFNERIQLEAPVGFLEISQIHTGSDPGTEELALILTWTLRILLDSTLPNANIALQSLLVEAALAINQNTFGAKMTPARNLVFLFESIPEAWLTGSISWQHEIHVGKSIWKVTDFIQPHVLGINFREVQNAS